MHRIKIISGIARTLSIVLASLLMAACAIPQHDVLLRGGTIYDGSGGSPVVGDVAIDGDRISVIGDLSGHHGATEISAASPTQRG